MVRQLTAIMFTDMAGYTALMQKDEHRAMASRDRQGAVLERATGRPYELVLLAGHPTRVPLWRQLRRAAYDRPVARVVEPETTAFGAAVMAAHAVRGGSSADLVASRAVVDGGRAG